MRQVLNFAGLAATLVLFAFAGVQVGFVRAVEEVAGAYAAEDCEVPCPNERDGQCPPQCDDCLCCAGIGSAATPAPLAALLVFAFQPRHQVLSAPVVAREGPRVFRPPRLSPIA